MNKTVLLVGVIALGLFAVCTPSLFANICGPKLEGAWQPDDFGTRVEITGDTMLVLWRNAPVLETKFTVSGEGGKRVLHLEKDEMRNARDGRVFARITGCWVEDGMMHLLQHYDIAGDDEEILKPTKESRYGDVTVVSEKMMPRLRGRWITESDGGGEMEFIDGTLRCRLRNEKWNGPVPIAVTRDNDEPERIRIVHRNPAEQDILYFFDLRYVDGKLVARVHIDDDDPIRLVFEKAR